MITPEPKKKTKAVSYDPMGALKEWHQAANEKKFMDEADKFGRVRRASLRLSLITEEAREVADELLDIMNGGGDREKLAKELADLLYVTYGCADLFDIPLPAVFKEVHRSNMTKVQSEGKVERRDDGKILKGPNYQAPDIASVMYPQVAD